MIKWKTQCCQYGGKTTTGKINIPRKQHVWGGQTCIINTLLPTKSTCNTMAGFKETYIKALLDVIAARSNLTRNTVLGRGIQGLGNWQLVGGIQTLDKCCQMLSMQFHHNHHIDNLSQSLILFVKNSGLSWDYHIASLLRTIPIYNDTWSNMRFLMCEPSTNMLQLKGHPYIQS